MAYSDRKTIDMDDTKHCTPCKTRDKKTKAEYYCTDCEAYYCEECFEIHPRVPYLAKHIVLKHDDIDVWSRDQYKCSTHGKNLEFFCKEHKMLCCHVCISLKHRSCTDMEYISESAMQSDLEDHIKKMNEKIEDQLQMIESHTDEISKKAVTNQSSKTEYIKELESFRSRIKAMFDSLIEKAFEELNERFDDNTKYADNSNEKLVRFKSRLSDLQQQLKSTTVGKEVLVYISLKRGENLIEEISKELSNIDLSTDNDHYKPVIDEKIEKYVKDLQKIAFLEDEKMRQECVASEDCRKEDFKEVESGKEMKGSCSFSPTADKIPSYTHGVPVVPVIAHEPVQLVPRKSNVTQGVPVVPVIAHEPVQLVPRKSNVTQEVPLLATNAPLSFQPAPKNKDTIQKSHYSQGLPSAQWNKDFKPEVLASNALPTFQPTEKYKDSKQKAQGNWPFQPKQPGQCHTELTLNEDNVRSKPRAENKSAGKSRKY